MVLLLLGSLNVLYSSKKVDLYCILNDICILWKKE